MKIAIVTPVGLGLALVFLRLARAHRESREKQQTYFVPCPVCGRQVGCRRDEACPNRPCPGCQQPVPCSADRAPAGKTDSEESYRKWKEKLGRELPRRGKRSPHHDDGL